jgi:RNase P subunit RPR2
MTSDRFNQICLKLAVGTKIKIKLAKDLFVTGELVKYRPAKAELAGSITIKNSERVASFSMKEIRSIAKEDLKISDEAARREFCSVCKVTFDPKQIEYISYSESQGDTAVFACAHCLGSLGQLQVLKELEKYYSTRRRMKNVLNSIRGCA